MIALAPLLAALTVVSPADGETVPTLRPGQKTYLAGARSERFVRLDNAAERVKLFRMGASQMPVKLEWAGATNAVYELTIGSDGGEEETFVLTNRTNAYVTNLNLARTYRWMVRCLDTEEFASSSFATEPSAPRLLRADGVRNFRDLGGWKTTDGKTVREDMIFRSAGLRNSSKSSGGFLRRKVEVGERRVTDAGLATLREDFKIKTDLELRTPQETAGMAGTLLGPDVRWENVSFAAYGFIDNSIRGREPFAKIFRLFTKSENYPILMHCSGGRDRTGTLAFLLNGLLGVPEDDLCRDWEASIFSDTGMTFSSERIVQLLDYLKTMPGETMRDRVEAYVRSCGVTAEEIAAFRSIMLK